MLDQETSNFIDPSAIPHLPFCGIHDESSLEALLIKRNQSVVSDALNLTQKLSGADQAQVKISFLTGPLEVPSQHSRLRFIFSQSKGTSHGYHFRIIETSQAERICRGFQGTLEYKAIPWSSNASDNCLGINLAPWWLHMMAWESHEICYWYLPLAENIGAQTKEFGLAVRPSQLALSAGGTECRMRTMGRVHMFLLTDNNALDSISRQTSLERPGRLCLSVHKQHQPKIVGILTEDQVAISPSLLAILLHFSLRMSPHAHTLILFRCAGS